MLFKTFERLQNNRESRLNENVVLKGISDFVIVFRDYFLFNFWKNIYLCQAKKNMEILILFYFWLFFYRGVGGMGGALFYDFSIFFPY